MSGPHLPTIMALARAGAVDEALRRFAEVDLHHDDPSALIVKGRLLKEQALRADSDERRRLYFDAAAAYRRSAEFRPATYPLINAATLSALAGDQAEARALAENVLHSVEEHPQEPETPYYRAATISEALLLLGRDDEARAALAEAISLAPLAWEDHATTLRQFRLVLEAQGRDVSWLAIHRPPRSLHFGGHMSFDPETAGRDGLERAIDKVIEEENVGFGYGALAAGADIIIAEALVDGGAVLHAILPGGPEAFASMSVDPFGMAWRRRFDALVERAETVRAVRPFDALPDPGTIALADEIAMGAAAMNARRLESEAVQLLVVDENESRPPAASATLDAQRIWAAGDRRQFLLRAPREEVLAVSTASRGEAEKRSTMAVIAIGRQAGPSGKGFEKWLGDLRHAIAEGPDPFVAPYWSGGQVLLGHERLADAAELVLNLAGRGERVGADYCAVAPFRDPFSNALRLSQADIAAAEAAADSTPLGTACVTEDFAAALAGRGFDGARTEYVGELDPKAGGSPMNLYALKR